MSFCWIQAARAQRALWDANATPSKPMESDSHLEESDDEEDDTSIHGEEQTLLDEVEQMLADLQAENGIEEQ